MPPVICRDGFMCVFSYVPIDSANSVCLRYTERMHIYHRRPLHTTTHHIYSYIFSFDHVPIHTRLLNPFSRVSQLHVHPFKRSCFLGDVGEDAIHDSCTLQQIVGRP